MEVAGRKGRGCDCQRSAGRFSFSVFIALPPLCPLSFCFATSQGDIVLLGMRDYQEDKVDIIHKYNADEARNLKAFGELPETGTCHSFHVSGFCVNL